MGEAGQLPQPLQEPHPGCPLAGLLFQRAELHQVGLSADTDVPLEVFSSSVLPEITSL